MGRRRLPPELVVEILLLLPPKPLFRNKSVSKEWLLLISDPFLAAAYQSQNPPFFAGFIDRSSTTFIPHNTQVVAPPHLPPPYSCYGSSNGLLLLLDSKMCYCALSVLNPITGASVQIPELPIPDNTASDAYGFICNLGSNGLASYKVFVVSEIEPSNRLQIAIFSSDTCEWVTSCIHLPRPVTFDNCCSRATVDSDGIIYLIDDDLMPVDGWWMDDDFTVVYCDPTEGSAELIESPPWDVDVYDCYFFSIREYYDGSLSVCRRCTRTGHFEVWVLSSDKTWTLKHTFSFDSEDDGDIQILYFCKDDRAMYLNLKSRIVRYYYEDEQRRFEDVCACKNPYDVKPFIFSPWPISIPAIAL